MAEAIRIFMTGVGGQGTLTATTLLAQTVLDQGLEVTSGEIHGMAQRGGVVESTILINCASPKLGPGEADILIGFEALETLRGLPYLKPGGHIFSSSEFQWPLAVSMGQATCPSLETIEAAASQCTDKARFYPSQAMGLQAGALQAGNIALLGAVAASGALPFDENALRSTLEKRLNPKIAGVNLKALDLGVAAARA